MKKYFTLLLLIPCFCWGQKKDTLVIDSLFWMGMRCGVAHWTEDGIFSCDFKGTLYPETIFDSTIRKWFVKMNGKDSLFYYRSDVERIFIWNGRPKNELYGYRMGDENASITIPNKYNGSDTLRVMEQVWRPKQ